MAIIQLSVRRVQIFMRFSPVTLQITYACNFSLRLGHNFPEAILATPLWGEQWGTEVSERRPVTRKNLSVICTNMQCLIKTNIQSLNLHLRCPVPLTKNFIFFSGEAVGQTSNWEGLVSLTFPIKTASASFGTLGIPKEITILQFRFQQINRQ